MFKKNIFNIIALAILLFSCLQLSAAIADDIGNLEKAVIGTLEKDKNYSNVRYTFLGTAFDENNKLIKVYLIQLPCIDQTGALCGSCAYENCKILAKKHLSLEQAVTKLTSPEQKKRIKKRAKTFRDWVSAKKVKKQWKKESMIFTNLQPPLKIGSTSFPQETKDRFKIRNNQDYSYINVIKTLDPANADIAGPNFKKKVVKDFQKSGYPVEVFMLNAMIFKEGTGHWIAIRIEETDDYDIAILFADSLHSNLFKTTGPTGFPYFKNSFIDLLKNLGYKPLIEKADLKKIEEKRKKEEDFSFSPISDSDTEEESSSEEEDTDSDSDSESDSEEEDEPDVVID